MVVTYQANAELNPGVVILPTLYDVTGTLTTNVCDLQLVHHCLPQVHSEGSAQDLKALDATRRGVEALYQCISGCGLSSYLTTEGT